MPRDSNGTYTLPAGNPVVTLTTIASSWANNTMSDIATALTGSLSRAGDGGMTAPLELADGSAGAPGLSWGTETTSGLYRAGAGDFRYSVSSTAVWQTVAGAFRVVAGSVGTPSISFITDTNTGAYLAGTDTIGFTGNGAAIASMAPAQFLTVNGTVALPGISFIADPDSGLYRIGANNIGMAVNGAIASQWAAQGFGLIDGAAATPSLYFGSDPNTGLYWISADIFAFATNGTERARISTTAVTLTLPLYAADGAAGSPSITFSADTDNGFYRPSANQINYTTNAGATPVSFGTTGVGVIDGSTTSPSVFFQVDTNTGIYRVGTDTCGVSHGGVAGAIGYRDGLRYQLTGSFSLTQSESGRVGQFVGGGAGTTITVPTSGVSESTLWMLITTTGCTVTPSAGTLYWFNGASLTTGTRTLATGAVVTIMSNPSSTDAYIWGNGIS